MRHLKLVSFLLGVNGVISGCGTDPSRTRPVQYQLPCRPPVATRPLTGSDRGLRHRWLLRGGELGSSKRRGAFSCERLPEPYRANRIAFRTDLRRQHHRRRRSRLHWLGNRFTRRSPSERGHTPWHWVRAPRCRRSRASSADPGPAGLMSHWRRIRRWVPTDMTRINRSGDLAGHRDEAVRVVCDLDCLPPLDSRSPRRCDPELTNLR